MNIFAVGYRFILANIISLIVGVKACLGIVISILRNPFKNPWATKLKLEPPAALSDPKYGVHKYIKANVSYIFNVFNSLIEYFSYFCLLKNIKLFHKFKS